MAAGTYDANGIWIYGEDDPASPVSDLLNLLGESASAAFDDDRARLVTLEAVGAWSSFTPILMASTTNPTLGTGSVAFGRFTRIGDVVHYVGELKFGTSGVNAGSGDYRIQLPVPAATLGSLSMGQVWCYDLSATLTSLAFCTLFTSTYFQFRHHGGTTHVTNAVPWTWAAGDIMRFNLTYEAAA